MVREIKPKNRLVLALDVFQRDRALEIVEDVKGSVDAVKINYPLIWGSGPGIVTDISKSCAVICDLKIADIPNTNRLICEQAFGRGASAVIAHAFVGPDSLQACVDVADNEGGEVYTVVEMSHPGGKQMFEDQAGRLCSIAKDAGSKGIIAPATRPERIGFAREIVGREMKILSPGVGAQGGKTSGAIDNGADFVIVGRGIYQADDPGEAARALVSEIEEAL